MPKFVYDIASLQNFIFFRTLFCVLFILLLLNFYRNKLFQKFEMAPAESKMDVEICFRHSVYFYRNQKLSMIAGIQNGSLHVIYLQKIIFQNYNYQLCWCTREQNIRTFPCKAICSVCSCNHLIWLWNCGVSC
jgi:hypothetical protein